MAKIFSHEVLDEISYGDFISELDGMGADFFDVKNIKKTAALMNRLFYNREFLSNHLNNILDDVVPVKGNLYTSQVFMLEKNDRYAIRAPLWLPARGDYGEEVFVYGMPHDHNFNILTMGYLGSGYKTKIWQYDSELVGGVVGERVNMSGEMEFTLSEGKLLFMEMNKDIHVQYPPAELSVSINIMQIKNVSKFQYLFDVVGKKIVRKVNEDTATSLFKMAQIIGNEDTANLLERIGCQFSGDVIGEAARKCAENLKDHLNA